MTTNGHAAVAIVGVGAILPDAPDVGTFWNNLTEGRYSIGDVDPARWDPALYWDADPHAPDRTYSKLGGWVREWEWDPLGWQAADPAARGRRDGRRPEVGGRLHSHGADGLRLARAAAGPGAHRGRARQRDGRREALPDVSAARVPRAGTRPRRRSELRRAAAGRARSDRVRAARADGSRPPADQRGHDAGRARQLPRRPGREPLQPARAELRRRCGLRIRDGRHGRVDPGPARRTSSTRS